MKCLLSIIISIGLLFAFTGTLAGKNSSSRGSTKSSSTTTSKPKTVKVKNYTKKDGTKVDSYKRSKPTKKK